MHTKNCRTTYSGMRRSCFRSDWQQQSLFSDLIYASELTNGFVAAARASRKQLLQIKHRFLSSLKARVPDLEEVGTSLSTPAWHPCTPRVLTYFSKKHLRTSPGSTSTVTQAQGSAPQVRARWTVNQRQPIMGVNARRGSFRGFWPHFIIRVGIHRKDKLSLTSTAR